MPPERTTDAELRTYDVSLLLRYGLTPDGAHRTALFGDGAVAAALAVEEAGVLPRALTYLAEVVRRDGLRRAALLPEPLPGRAATALAGDWLTAASSVLGPTDLEGEERVARWLETVATLLALRRVHGAHRRPGP